MSSIESVLDMPTRLQLHTRSGTGAQKDPLRAQAPTYNSSQTRIVHEQQRAAVFFEIEAYAAETYLREFYGGYLSTERCMIYEPEYPPPQAKSEKTFRLPRNTDRGEQILGDALRPVIGWYTSVPLTGPVTRAEVLMQAKIERALERYKLEREARSEPRTRPGQGFLYRNLPDAAVELNVAILINRTHTFVQRRQWESAESTIDKAINLSETLNYNPITARCYVWKAIIEMNTGRMHDAADTLENARPCAGRYPESHMLLPLFESLRNEVVEYHRNKVAEDGTDVPEWKLIDLIQSELDSSGLDLNIFKDAKDRVTMDSTPPFSTSSSESAGLSPRRLEMRVVTESSIDADILGLPRPKIPIFHRMTPESSTDQTPSALTDELHKMINEGAQRGDLEPQLEVPKSMPVSTSSEPTSSPTKVNKPRPLNLARSADVRTSLKESPPNTAKSSLFLMLCDQLRFPVGGESKSHPGSDELRGQSPNHSPNPKTSIRSGRSDPEDEIDRFIAAQKVKSPRRKISQRLQPKVDEVELREMMEAHRSRRPQRIQARYERHKPNRTLMRTTIAAIHREELKELRQKFGDECEDPYVAEFAELIDQALERERAPHRAVDEGASDREPKVRSLLYNPPAKVVDSSSHRRKSVPAAVLSDTPAVKEVELEDWSGPTVVSSIEFNDLLRKPARKMSVSDSSSNKVGSPSPLRKASVPGDWEASRFGGIDGVLRSY